MPDRFYLSLRYARDDGDLSSVKGIRRRDASDDQRRTMGASRNDGSDSAPLMVDAENSLLRPSPHSADGGAQSHEDEGVCEF